MTTEAEGQREIDKDATLLALHMEGGDHKSKDTGSLRKLGRIIRKQIVPRSLQKKHSPGDSG